MPAILSFDPNNVNIPEGHFIDGRYCALGDERLAIRRPSDGVVYGAVLDAAADAVDAAVTAGQRAMRDSDWACGNPRDRAKVLRRWAGLIDEHCVELAQLEAVGSTRPLADARAWDVPFTAECLRFFAEYSDKLGGEIAATRHDHLGMVISEPYGVVAAITPWNFPLVMAIWKCGAAMAAGNAVVLKPSELTPFSALRLAELAVAAGVPHGILNVINGRGERAGNLLVRHPGIGKVTFTGATGTGIAIMTAAAESGPKPVTLELGGKSPQVVFADARDLERVADIVSRSVLLNAGQVCVAGSRLIVQRQVADELLEHVVRRFQNARPGATWDPASTLPPLASIRQAETADDIVRRTLSSGATALTGGTRIQQDGGEFYAPTILSDLPAHAPALTHELFAPVLTLQRFDDEDEAYALATHESYGLAAGVHTRDLARAMRAMRKIEAGTIWINRYGRTDDLVIPTGGYKKSGLGKDLGRQAVEANLRHKSILLDFSE